jgi:hypothetical protein
MYCFGIAPSSAGKDHPTKMIDRLFVESGVGNMVGGSDLTSDTAMMNGLKGLERQSGFMLIWDECGHIVRNVKNGAHGGSSNTIIPMLMRLYSAASSTYRPKMMANKEDQLQPIEQPHVCLWGVTTHEALFGAMKMESLRDGFLGRILPFVSDLEPVYVSGRYAPWPKHILKHWSKMYDLTLEIDDSNLLGLPKITVIKEEDSARVMRERFCRLCEQVKVAYKNDHEALWGKAHENCRKIALTIAGGTQEKMITGEIMDYSIELTRMLVIDYQRQVDENIFETEHEKRVKQAVQKLRKKVGGELFSKTDFTKANYYLKSKERDEVWEDIIEESHGFVTKTKKSVAKKYKLVDAQTNKKEQ